MNTLHRGTKIILLNLTASDFLTGISVQPPRVYFLFLQFHGHTSCSRATVAAIISIMLTVASFTTLLVTTAERYLSIFHPNLHKQFIKSFKINFAIAFVWIFSTSATIFNTFPVIRQGVSGFLVAYGFSKCTFIVFSYIKVSFKKGNSWKFSNVVSIDKQQTKGAEQALRLV